jgi:hypothetical protein
MDIGPDTRRVTNPARTAARKKVADAQEELATAERALPQLLNSQGTPKQKNAALPEVHARIDTALAAVGDAGGGGYCEQVEAGLVLAGDA